MYSNWASRSGWLAPSSALRLTCREKPISVSSLRTLLGLTEWPMAASADANLSRLFDTHSRGRTGSPNVAGSTRRLRSSNNVASRSLNRRGPPPSRRTRPAQSGGASRSFSPRSMVLRARPVTFETAARPPQPAARTSLAANNRLPRSSRFEPSNSQRCRIACVSIMAALVAQDPESDHHSSPSHAVACPPQSRFTYRCGRPNSCRNRHCPKCQGAAAKEWLAEREAELLPVSYFHVVFSLPGRIADIAYQNKAVIYDLLFKASSETMLTIAADPKHLGARIGITSVLHTWGSAMTHHPHSRYRALSSP